MKTIIFGLDAFDFRYLERYQDSLPHLGALRGRGVEADLESTHPPWTGSAWPSMYTGTDPSHHGVYGFFSYDGYPDSGRVVSRADVDNPALWEYLSNAGRSSVVMNVPVTHPASSLSGVLLPGYLANEADPGYPESIRERLETQLGEPYRIYSSHETDDNPDKKLRGYLDLIDLRRRAALAILEDVDWECAFIQVQKTDAVFHNFDSDRDFRAIYGAADRLVGDVLNQVTEPVNVIVCSDHGIGPVTGYSIYVNEILRQHGFLEATTEGRQLSLESTKSSLLGMESSTNSESHRRLQRGLDVLAGVGITPNAVYTLASRLGLEDALVRLTPASLRNAAAEDVDWRNSRAYCADPTRLGIRINLEGREPAGVVPEAEYESVRAELIDIFSHLETPDGEPAFKRVCRREAYYDGPHTASAPDILFFPTDMNHKISTALYGRQFVSADIYDHKRNGVFIGAGPAFTDDIPATLSLTDVAPITLATLEQAIPERMTGRVPDGLLTEAFTPHYEFYEELDFTDTEKTATPTDEQAVTERLEDMGYL